MEKVESRGEVLRELLEEGRKMEAIRLYKEGKASIGKASRIAGISVSELMDLLAEFGVKSSLNLEDFRESLLHAKSVRVGR